MCGLFDHCATCACGQNYGLLIEFSRSLFCCCPQSVVFGGKWYSEEERRAEQSGGEGRDGGGWWGVCVGKLLLKVAVIYFH